MRDPGSRRTGWTLEQAACSKRFNLSSPSSSSTNKTAIIVGVIGALATVTAATITGIATYSAGVNSPRATAQPPGPPTLQIAGYKWVDNQKYPGRYELSGSVQNLAVGQLVWTYNEPLGSNGEEGPIFPDPGPCPVAADLTWKCDSGFAGDGDAKYRGKRFKLWAAVVSEEQGYSALKTKLALGAPGNSYSSSTEVPRVSGDKTLDSLTITRP